MDYAECYSPRHGILFYDSAKNLLGFLEICLECQGNKHFGIPNIDIDSNGQYEALRVFFKEECKQ